MLDLPSALVEQTGEFPVDVGIAAVFTKTALTGQAKALNRSSVGMQPEGVPVDVFMDQPASARLDALIHPSQEGLQLGQKHGHPAAPHQIEEFPWPGIFEQILLAEFQLMQASLFCHAATRCDVNLTAFQPQDATLGTHSVRQICCSEPWPRTQVEHPLPQMEAGALPGGLGRRSPERVLETQAFQLLGVGSQ